VPLSGLVTATRTLPAACAGVLTVMVVLPRRLMMVAFCPPIVTVASLLKPEPVIITVVPPAVLPDEVLMRLTTTVLIFLGKPMPAISTVFGLLLALLANTRFAVWLPTVDG